MSWRDSLRPASFRGVEFLVNVSDAQFGRNVAEHVFPKRDKVFVEDLGRKARTIRIDALVIGRDYDQKVQALIAAIEQPGPGKLVHPTLGELRVSLDNSGAGIHEDLTGAGGMARVSFNVIEAGDAVFPSIRLATQDVVQAKADTARAATTEAFGKSFLTDGLPQFAKDLSVARVQTFIDTTSDVLGAFGDGLTRGGILSAIGLLSPDLQAQIRAPLDLATAVVGIIGSLRRVLPSGDAALALKRFNTAATNETPWESLTATRKRDDANRAAWVELVGSTVAIERALALIATDFSDYDAALRLRDQVMDGIDAVRDKTINDSVFASLSDLRASVVQDVAARGADLTHIGGFVPEAVQPALVITNMLYGDATRDVELIAQNASIHHPGFVPAGASLQVVIDA